MLDDVEAFSPPPLSFPEGLLNLFLLACFSLTSETDDDDEEEEEEEASLASLLFLLDVLQAVLPLALDGEREKKAAEEKKKKEVEGGADPAPEMSRVVEETDDRETRLW